MSTSLGDKESDTIGKGRHIPYPTDQERIEEDISAAGFDDEVIEKGGSEHESAFQGERSKEKEEVLGEDGGEFDRMSSSPDSTLGTGSKYSTGHEIPDVERNTSDTESEARTEEDNARKNTVLPDGETEPQKMTSQHINHDISTLQKSRVNDETKLWHIQNRMPEINFKFPGKRYKDKSESSGFKQRYCKREWLQHHEYLSYSKEADGLFCLACLLFPVRAYRGQRANNLIKEPYRNWKDALFNLRKHATLEYHIRSKMTMDGFLETTRNPSLNLASRMSSKIAEQVASNRKFLVSIIKSIELCGHQGIALRGHRDDSTSEALNQGNFKALIDFRIDAGDDILKEHLKSCGRNATYVSKMTQNELLQCMRQYTQDSITTQVKASGFYGISADEVTDVSNWEQIGLVVRYLHNNQPVEKLLEFIECESCTGQQICEHIVTCLRNLGLNPELCRAQTYDGAGNMAGVRNGCAAEFMKTSPRAPYYHCASHGLNLALCYACKVPEIHNMICTLRSLGYFFRNSPKRQRAFEESIVAIIDKRASCEEERPDNSNKDGEGGNNPAAPACTVVEEESDDDDDDDDNSEGDGQTTEDYVPPHPREVKSNPLSKQKIKPICETRWVERHSALMDFEDLYEPLIHCLERISQNEDRRWSNTTVEASGLLHQITSSTFIASFQSALYLFGFTFSLSQNLQGSELDVIQAYNKVKHIKDELSAVRQNSKRTFGYVWGKATSMSNAAGVSISVPRTCAKQTLRSNTSGKNPSTFYRRTVFVPFLDSLLQQLGDRFEGLSAHALQGIMLMPNMVQKLTSDVQERLLAFYEPDLPFPKVAPQELQLWRRHW